MASPDTMTLTQFLTLTQFFRPIGLPEAPTVIDVRTNEDFARDQRTLPGSLRRDYRTVTTWAEAHAGRTTVVVCQIGMKLSQGVAAWRRPRCDRTEVLKGGFEAWLTAADVPLVLPDHLPPHDAKGRAI